MLKEKTTSKATIIGVAAAMATSMALAPMAFAEEDADSAGEDIAIENAVPDEEAEAGEPFLVPMGVEATEDAEVEAALDKLDPNREVYYVDSESATKYHLDRDCLNSSTHTIKTMSLSEARQSSKFSGLCGNCKEELLKGTFNTETPETSDLENENASNTNNQEPQTTLPVNAENAATTDTHTFDPSQWTALVPKSHEHYHLYDYCQGLTNADWDNMSYMSVEEAVNQGLPLCEKCQATFISEGYSLDQLPRKSNAQPSSDAEVVDQPKASTEKSEKSPTISKTADGQAAAIVAAAIAAGIGIVGARRMSRR